MKIESFTQDGKYIVYEEGFWTGKKTITIDGVTLENESKKVFTYTTKILDEVYGEVVNIETYTLKGNILFGAELVGETNITVVPKLKVWEIILILLPILLVLSGGAVGGFFGGFFAVLIACVFRKIKSAFVKVLAAIALTGVAYACYFAVVALILLIGSL